MADSARLERALGHSFRDANLLKLALTHRSVGRPNNERLEFLGDAVLDFVVAQDLYDRFEASKEGALSRLRSKLVKGETLADIALDLELGDYLLLGSGERRSGGHRRRSILADTLEALFGAVLLDAGVERVTEVILTLYATRLASLDLDDARKDAKTRLQEHLQGRNGRLPNYRLVEEEGEDHARRFRVECSLEDPAITREGQGTSRRKAEQQAAGAVLAALGLDAHG